MGVIVAGPAAIRHDDRTEVTFAPGDAQILKPGRRWTRRRVARLQLQPDLAGAVREARYQPAKGAPPTGRATSAAANPSSDRTFPLNRFPVRAQ